VRGVDSRPFPHASQVWRAGVRRAVLAAVTEFVTDRCSTDLGAAGVDIAHEVLTDFISAGKCVRSTFMYLGWLCGAKPDDSRNEAALRGAASFELLHTFALLQDDVMDDSAFRRGGPSAHVRFTRWHAERRLGGSAERFGASAAVLLGDLCLVWAEQMLRGSGLDVAVLERGWPRYDEMRTELAVGQFADLVNDAGQLPTLPTVLDVARRKSGNYTVRRPLEIGAALAGCPEPLLGLLGRYGAAVGEAFQLRDDVLGIFGSPTVTGKPAGGDLVERKATTVVVAAHHLADAATRRQLTELMAARDLDQTDVARWRALILATGAVSWIEELISDRLSVARQSIRSARVAESVRDRLESMASACAQRAA
jgi:geranylgeranyl diphosphate synthase type I